MAPLMSMKKVTAIVVTLLVIGLGSFFSLIHYWTFLSFVLPFNAAGLSLSFLIQFVHYFKNKHLRKHFDLRIDRWHRRNHMAAVVISSLLRGSIVYALCGGATNLEYFGAKSKMSSEPRCVLLNSPMSSPLKVIGILSLAYLFYLDLCVVVDMCMFAFPGVRHPLYKVTVAWQSSLHFTATTISLFVMPIYPISAYVFTKYTSNSGKLSAGNFGPLIVYALHLICALDGLYHNLATPKWNYARLDFKQLLESVDSSQLAMADSRQISAKTKDKDKVEESDDDSSDSDDSEDMRPLPLASSLRIDVQQCATRDGLSVTGDELKVVQITDPHIGSFMTVDRLHAMCVEIVASKPHLILITGDFWTGENNIDGLLTTALEPLKPMADRCFACLGNHDMESSTVLQRAIDELQELGIKLLRQEQAVIDIADFGKVQLLGFDYMAPRKKSRGELIRKTFAENPKPEDCRLRVVLLHDPSAFCELRGDEKCVVFSGHTHGGHMGLLSCGIRRTAFSLLLPFVPDFGVFAKDTNALYVHRGQGSRSLFGNLVLNVGVPSEQTLLFVKC